MAVVQNYLPGDSHLIDKIVYELKSQGIFDQFRKECIADVDTKPAYQNLRQRVEGSVSGFLTKQRWKLDMNKNHVREMLRKNIYESGFLETGVERIVDQVVNPKINSVFLPKVTEVVYKFLGIEQPNVNRNKFDSLKLSYNSNSLLPTDLEAVSPESEPTDKKHDRSSDSQNLDDSKIDEDESPPFEPIEEQTTYLPVEENSVDSHLSGFSGLISHDSNQSQEMSKPMQIDISNQDSIISKHSSDGHLSIIMSDNDTKMEICEDSHQSKSSKTNDSNSKNFDFNHENSSKSSISTKIEKKAESKSEDKSKSGKSKSHEKHKSRHDSKCDLKERKDDRDRKSDHDKRDRKEKHSSKDCEKSKDNKDRKDSRSSSKTDKDRDSKSEKEKDSKSEKDRDLKLETKDKSKSNSRNCSGSKDKSSYRKESGSKDKERCDSGSREKSKYSNNRDRKDLKSKDDKGKGESKSHSKHESKSNKYKKDDRHHSKNDKHSSGSKSKEKDKKDLKKEKKENKDDHFSSKKRSDRRSTDRDSNDGQSGLKSSSSSFDSYFSSQTQSKSQESSTSNSNTGSGESGASDVLESEIVNLKAPITFKNEEIENIGEILINTEIETAVPRIKLIKPKFASNIHEARRLMKIRKQLSKIEQQNVLEFASVLNNTEGYLIQTDIVKEKFEQLDADIYNNFKHDCKPDILQKGSNIKKPNKCKNKALDIPFKEHSAPESQICGPISPPLKSSVVSAASWDALEAKLNQSIDYSTHYDDPDTPEKSSEQVLNTDSQDCLYFDKISSPVTERYIKFMKNVVSKLEKEVSSTESLPCNNSSEQEIPKHNKLNIEMPKYNKVETEMSKHNKVENANGCNTLTKKALKRKLIEYHSDAKNNNKKFNHHIEEHESFSLPLSPAESDNSIDKKSDISESSERSIKKNEVGLSVKVKKNTISKTATQRYSSEDLYKPRPFFSGSRRRTARNLGID